MKKITVYILITSIIIGGAYFGYTRYYESNEVSSLGSNQESTIIRDELIDSVKVIGQAKLAHEQKLKFTQGGKVSVVNIKAGQMVKKGDLLASLEMTEFGETLTQAQDRVNLAQQKLESAQEKIGGLELQKLRAELKSLESKRIIIQQDLQKLLKSAPLRSANKELEREQKKSELESKEAGYQIDITIWKTDTENKKSLIEKKRIESQKIVTTTLQNINTDYSELNNIRNGINKIFGFNQSLLTNSERSDAAYVAYNVPGLRAIVETAWRDSSQSVEDIQKFTTSIEDKAFTKENAILVNDLFLVSHTKILDVIEKTIKALENSDIYDGTLSRTELDTLKNTVNGYRSTILTKINTEKDNKNTFPLLTAEILITSQVDKELAIRKQTLDTEKIAIEKLRVEIMDSTSPRVSSGSTLDISVRRDIDLKKQELLELEVNISGKNIDISKQTSGKTDEILSLETDFKLAQSELKKTLTKKEQYEIRAPIDGIIRNVKMFPGDTINTTSNSGNDGTIIIEDNDAVIISAKLNQKDIVRIRQNQEVNIKIDAFPDVTFTGTLSEISSSPDENANGGETTYEIQVLFSRGKNAIYSGMSANLDILISKREGVLFAPISSVSHDSVTGESFVTIIQSNGTTEKRIITTGLSDSDRIEVLSGVVEGEKIRSIDFNAEAFKSDGMGF